jgi:hypothetical protein
VMNPAAKTANPAAIASRRMATSISRTCARITANAAVLFPLAGC